MRLEHSIFQGPLEPGITLTKHKTPENYRSYPGGKDLPDELDVWKVHDGEFAKTVDVGLVSDPFGWEDSPDAEWISGGINSKGPRSVALGRHGNQFLWGFAGDASQLTESGKRVFLNTICYMARFDGQKPLVQKQGRSRDWVFLSLGYLRDHADNERMIEYVESQIPPDVLAETGLDADALETYYRENLEYLRPREESGFQVDEDCAALGISNRDVALLDRMVARFVADPDDALAQRVLGRYVHDGLHSPEQFSTWLEENRPYLFFSDVGGFRWYVDTYAKAEAERAAAKPAGTSR